MTRQELTSEEIAVLRKCTLPLGANFLRCGRNLGPSKAASLASSIASKLGDDPDQVFPSFNEKFGYGDYVRVERGSAAFALICQMKS